MLRLRRSPPRRADVAADVLRLLLGDPRVDLDNLDWTELRAVAWKGGVLVRLADAGRRRGEALPPRFAAATSEVCARAQHVLELVDHIGAACTRLGIAHAFLKVAERYPDARREVPVLIAEPSAAADRGILGGIPAARARPEFRTWLAGTAVYHTAHGLRVTIRHGRLGQLGEHARYARILLGRAIPAAAGVTTFRAPSGEDNLLLLAAHQTFTRPAFRLGDVYGAIAALRSQPVNWDYLFATALSMGMVPALGAYVGYLHDIHARLLGAPLIDQSVLSRFAPPRRSVAAGTQFPRAGGAARLYLRQVGASLEAGRWHSAVRLSLLPLVAAMTATTHTKPA